MSGLVCVCVCVCEREREREREREFVCVQTHRLTDRKTDTRSCPVSCKREGGGEKERERERESLCAYTQTHRRTDRQTDRQTHTHTQSHHILDKYEDIDCV